MGRGRRPSGMGILARLLDELGLPSTPLSILLAHADAVRRNGQRLGLLSPADLDRVEVRHTADSLLFALVRAPAPREDWADVGSGAGFPGLVLACCYPETRFVLVEPSRRRAGFLELVTAGLGLVNVEIVAGRADEIGERFDVAVARALVEPSRALRTLETLTRPGGSVVLAVGPGVARPDETEEVRLRRAGVDSPGRFLVLHRTAEAEP